jgi:hypothetical protein
MRVVRRMRVVRSTRSTRSMMMGTVRRMRRMVKGAAMRREKHPRAHQPTHALAENSVFQMNLKTEARPRTLAMVWHYSRLPPHAT